MGRSYPLLLVRQSSDRVLAEEGTAPVAVHRSFDMVVVDRIGLEEVDSPAEEDSLPVVKGSPDRSRVAGGLGCSLVGRTDRMDLTWL